MVGPVAFYQGNGTAEYGPAAGKNSVNVFWCGEYGFPFPDKSLCSFWIN
jgi:hypothetical protein